MNWAVRYVAAAAILIIGFSCKAHKSVVQQQPTKDSVVTMQADTTPAHAEKPAPKVNPEAEKFYKQGLAKRDAQDLPGAIELFSEAIKTDSTFLDAYYERATANYALMQYTPAVRDDDFLYAKGYPNPIVYARVGQRYAAMENWTKALEVYNKGVSIADTSKMLLLQLGNLQVHVNQFDKAVKTLKKVLNMGPPETAVFYTNLGYSLSRIGDNREAAFYLSKAIQLNPSDRLVYAFRGYALLNIHEFAMAESDYRYYLEENPLDVPALYNLARTQYEQKKFNEAITLFKKVSEIEPDYLDNSYMLGVCYGDINDYKTALTYLDKAIQKDPSKGLYYFTRGIAKIELKSGDYCADFHKALDLNFQKAQVMLDQYCK
jgi:tetratricopeptide (TPR) repeat protein